MRSAFGSLQRHRRSADIAVGALTALLSVALAYRMFGMHRGDIAKPLLTGDGLTIYALAKAAQQHGWFSPNPSLGFPVGQDLAPFPNLDLVHLLGLWVLTQVTSSPFTAVNIFNLWGFAAIAGAAYLVLRYAGVRIILAAPLAVSLSIAPWHFQRLEGHLFLANYSSLLIGLLIALIAIRRIREDGGRRPLARADAGWFAILLACGFYLAGGGLYWLFISGIVIALAVLPALAVNLSRRSAAYAGIALIPAPVFAWLWLRAQSAFSTYPVIVPAYGRQFIESELYAGTISTLFLGSLQSGIGLVADRRTLYGNSTALGTNIESGPWNSVIGALAVITTFALMLLLVSTLWGTRDADSGNRVARLRAGAMDIARDGWLAAFVVVFLLFAATSINSIIMLYWFQEIRAWGRFFIELIIIATIVLGLVLTRLSRLREGPALAIVVAAVIAVVVVADQVRGSYRLDFETIPAVAADARALVQDVEQVSDPDCGELVLPAMPFPENGPILAMADYDPLWLYVGSDDLRFTYGVPKAQPEAAWLGQFTGTPTAEWLPALQEAGVCGVFVDTAGYEEPGSVIDALQAMTGNMATFSPTRRWAHVAL